MDRKLRYLWHVLIVVAVAAGCTEKSEPVSDLAGKFSPTGSQILTRELGIYSGAVRVGDLRMYRIEGRWQGREEVVQTKEDVLLRLSFRGDRFDVNSSQTSWIGKDLDLKASQGVVDFGAGAWETRAVKVEDGVYLREQITTGSRNSDRISIPEGVLISELLPFYFENADLEKGRTVELRAYNLTLGQEFPITIQYRGVAEGSRLYAFNYWGMEERLWIDESGMPVREDMALGVSAREPGADERKGYLPLETVLSQSEVPGIGIPEDLALRDKAAFFIEGSFRLPPQGKWQLVKGTDELAEVTVIKPVIPRAEDRLPDPGLMPSDTRGLDLDSKKIKDLAAKITKPYDDPWEKALAIGKWVHGKLGKSMRECFSSLQVLDAGEGECQSHSLLTISLCRKAGLPARFAYGVVFLPERKAFGFHTWVEVHVGEWIPIDPTLGHFPAGVDHLTLAIGAYQDQFRLFPYIMGKGGWRIKFRGS